MKTPNPPKEKIVWWVHAHSGPNILGPTAKFKILLAILFSSVPKVSKKVCHTHLEQKPREEIDFLETGCF